MSNASTHNWVMLMEKGDLQNYTIKVLRYIKDNPNTDIDKMRHELNLPHQTLSSRVSELMDEGLVEIVGDRTSKESISYSLIRYVEGTFRQKQVKEQRLRSKYMAWVNKGIREYKDIMPSQLLMELSYIQSQFK